MFALNVLIIMSSVYDRGSLSRVVWMGFKLVIVKGTALGQSALIPNPAIFVRAYQTPGYFDCLLFPLELLAGVLRNNIKVMVCLVNDFGIAQLL